MFCSRKMNRKINHIHERALRLVYDDYLASFQDLLKRDKTVSIHHRNIQYVAIEMYKVINELCPQSVRDIFEIKDDPIKSRKTFIRPKIKTVYKGEGSLRNFGPLVWNNMIPDEFKNYTTLQKFKKAIKTWIPENCPCRLCKNYVQGLGFISVTE